jgi:DivIVA domain-containing protein
MELSPAAITGVEFDQVRKGYDPEQVRSFLNQIARGVEAMKAQLAEEQGRARQAQARLVETQAKPTSEAVDADAISRALVLAQKTADAAIGEARSQAASIVAAAEERAQNLANDAEAKAADRILRAETEARRRGEEERARADAELKELLARRDRTQGELERLERALAVNREHIRSNIDRLHEVLSASTSFEASGDTDAPASARPPMPSAPSAPPAAPAAAGDVSVPPLREVPSPSPAPSPAPAAVVAGGASPVTPAGEDAVRAFFAESPDEDRWRPGATT